MEDQSDEVASEATSPYAASQSAFLLTLHHPRGQGTCDFVTVQASHHNETHRFPDLASAFDYLRSIADVGGTQGNRANA